MRRFLLAVLMLLVAVPAARGVVIPEYGAAISIRSPGPVTTLDPAAARNDSERDLVRLLFDTLVVPGPGGFLPAGAERWSSAEGGGRWTFRLRPGLAFSDGTPVTADSWIASWNRLKTAGPEWAWLLDGADPSSPDARTLVIGVNPPDPGFLRRVAVPAAAAVRVVEGKNGRSLLGSGPFRFAGRKDGAFLLIPRLDHPDGRPFPAGLRWSVGGTETIVGLIDAPGAPDRVVPRPASDRVLILNGGRPALAGDAARRAVRTIAVRSVTPPDGAGRLSGFSGAPADTAAPAAIAGASLTVAFDAEDAPSAAAAADLVRALADAGARPEARGEGGAAFDAVLDRGGYDIAVLRWDPADVDRPERELVMRPEVAAAFGSAPPAPDPLVRADQADTRSFVVPLFRLAEPVRIASSLAGFGNGPFDIRAVAGAFERP